jgi:hypothetical protein
MDAVLNALSCLMALGASMFLWRKPLGFYKESGMLALFLGIFILFSYFTIDSSDAALEHLPFRMLALSICFSTTSLTNHKTRYLVLAQVLWLWVEFFGGLIFVYRGLDMPWTRVVAVASGAVGGAFLSHISREMEFLLMVYWIAIWMFF